MAAPRRVLVLGCICLLALMAMATGRAQAVPTSPDAGVAIGGSLDEVTRSVDVLHAAGVRWVSLGTTWEGLEPSPGAFPDAPWADLQQKVQYAKGRGMQVELTIVNAPAWASGVANARNDPPTPANLPAYGTFLTTLALRLGPYVDAYAPWNEPNIPIRWNPVDPVAYANLQKVAYPAFKAGDPTATVLTAPIVYGHTTYDYVRKAYEAGLAGSVDVFAWTTYPSDEPERARFFSDGLPSGGTLPVMFYLHNLIEPYDPGRKIWIMEISYSTCSCSHLPANNVTEAQQADYVTRIFQFRRRYLEGITDRIFWYRLRDPGTLPDEWTHHQGLLRFDSSPKPALAALAALATESPAGGGSTTGGGSGGATGGLGGALPPSVKAPLPAKASSPRGRVVLGKLRLTAKRGKITLRLKVGVTGGPVRLRIDGYRARHWRKVSVLKVPRSGTLKVTFPDKTYLAIRVRTTLPGGTTFRTSRLARVVVKR